MSQYAYSPIAYQMAMQITGRNTQAIQDRFAKVDIDIINELIELAEDLAEDVAEDLAEGDDIWGDFWDKMNKYHSSNSLSGFEQEMFDTLTYIVGDSW